VVVRCFRVHVGPLELAKMLGRALELSVRQAASGWPFSQHRWLEGPSLYRASVSSRVRCSAHKCACPFKASPRSSHYSNSPLPRAILVMEARSRTCVSGPGALVALP